MFGYKELLATRSPLINQLVTASQQEIWLFLHWFVRFVTWSMFNLDLVAWKTSADWKSLSSNFPRKQQIKFIDEEVSLEVEWRKYGPDSKN